MDFAAGFELSLEGTVNVGGYAPRALQASVPAELRGPLGGPSTSPVICRGGSFPSYRS